jgi:protein-serine/threonine kinase
MTPKKLYFVLENCAGGELYVHMSRAGRFSESHCRFYASEILLAIEYLHRLNIIYRDLKLENILLDANGHVKLTDCGLSKEGIRDVVDLCGLLDREHLAPELLDRRGHGKAVDWYSLGVLMYKMLNGLRSLPGSPDCGFYPPIVEILTERDPNKRLGGGPDDGEEVKAHPFFSGTDWIAVQQRRTTPPIKPNARLET